METEREAGSQARALEFTILPGGLGFEEPVTEIIRSQDEWLALYTTYTPRKDLAYIGDKPPPFPYDVDFSKSMLVFVSNGRQAKVGPSVSPTLRIESLAVVDNVLQVRYVQHMPPKDSATLGGHFYPGQIAKTARVDLPVEFISRTEILSD